MYSSFSCRHRAVLSIPEMGLVETELLFEVEIDGLFESHHIDAVYIRTHRGDVEVDADDVEAIVKAFEADAALVDVMYEKAYEQCGDV